MIIKSVDELKEFLPRLGKEFAFDTETTDIKYYRQRIVGISFSNGKESCYIPLGHIRPSDKDKNLPVREVFSVINDFLKDRKTLVAYNFVFDAKVFSRYNVNIRNHEWVDVLVAAHLLDENRQSKKLKSLVIEVFDDDYGIDVTDAANVPVDVMATYAEKDSFYTYKLWEHYKPFLEEQELMPLFQKIEMPSLRAIMEMEINGIRVDIDRVNDITEQLEKEVLKLEEMMYYSLKEPYELQTNLWHEVTSVRGKYNFRSSMDLISILRDKLSLSWTTKTATGSLSVGKDALQELAGKHQFVDLLIKYKIAQKLLSAFFSPMPEYIDADGRIRPHFSDVGTATGRLSCKAPNLQQLPKSKKEFPIETRGCFVASGGYDMIACDFSGQELRVLAHISNDDGMLSAFNEGRDFHQEAADNMGVTRDKGKVFNFSLAYGKTTLGLSKDWGISEEEAEKLVSKHYEKYPLVKKAIEDCGKELSKKGFVTSLTGRRRRFKPAFEFDGKPGYSKKAYRQAFNFLIQGLSADMMRVAMIKVLNLKARNPDWDLRLLATVHDELVCEVREKYSEQAAEAIREAFVNSMKLRVGLEAEVKIGKSYAEVK